MRRLAILTIVCTATVFITCDWFWISKYFVKNLGNGSTPISTCNYVSIIKETPLSVTSNKQSRNKLLSFNLLHNKSSSKSHPQTSTPPKKALLIGISSIARKKEDYLHQTLQSLITNMDPKEGSDVTILVMFVDMDEGLRRKRAQEMALRFPDSVKSGLLLLVQAQPDTYPKLDIRRKTFNDSVDRIKWRSKQVLDFAYLLTYSKDLCDYFLILEDDVVATPRYVTAIRDFIREKENSDWVSLTFSSFFIIGRLMRSRDLGRLSEFLLMFHLEKPVDLLVMQFLDLLVPGTQTVTRRIPSLFQHIGLFSSLDGKVQKARDRSFTGASRVFHFKNPPADIVTTLGTYKKHFPELCYADSNKFFWGSAPKRNDTYDVIFRKPTRVKKIFVMSGTPSHKNDVIRHAELKVAPLFTKMVTDRKAECEGFRSVAMFEKGKVDVVLEEVVQCVRVEFVARHSNWVLINEISIESAEPD